MSARLVLVILYIYSYALVTFTADASLLIEEVFVTGSRIPGSKLNTVAPKYTFSSELAETYGLSSVSEIIRYLPFNTGSEFNADVFTQNLSVGTANFNLRGLGLSSTLVLLNGRRQTVSGAVSDDGSTFVDSNALVPISIVDRVEILKDGSSALYGSDAIAGVVNVITKRNLNGLELSAKTGITTKSAQTDILLSGTYGFQIKNLRAYGALEFKKQSWLPSPERGFTKAKGISSFGQPGSFILLDQSSVFPDLPFGEVNGKTSIDPTCGSAQGITRLDNEDTRLGVCLFDFSKYYHLVPREERLASFLSVQFEGTKFDTYVELGYVRMDAERGTSPSFPILDLVTIPAENPGNIYKTPALFLGRALGESAPINLVTHVSDTQRLAFGFQNRPNSLLSWDIGFSHSKNSYEVHIEDILADRFTAAINGKGGPKNDQFFNPFGSAELVPDSDPRYNSPLVIRDFLSTARYYFNTSMHEISGNVSKEFIATDATSIAASGGFQWRSEAIKGDFNDQFNAENYLFLIGGPDFSGQQNIFSGFGELYISFYDSVHLQLAFRKEFYDGVDSKINPKFALRWNTGVMGEAYLSYSTAFKTASTYQKFSSQTVLKNILDPLTQSKVFRGVRTEGDVTLKPETANVYSLGYLVSPMPNLQFKIDLWRFEYKNLIVKQNAQAIVNFNPLDSRVIRKQGQILRIDNSYINTSRVVTDGFDISGLFSLAVRPFDQWRVKADVTYINKYKIQTDLFAQLKDVSGSRNFTNFARSLPKWRSILSMEWARGGNALTALVRSISSYTDDQNQKRIRKHVTLDSHASLVLPGTAGFSGIEPVLTFGVLNIFDKDPPRVDTTVGYDSKVHDPRGRVIYIGLKSNL